MASCSLTCGATRGSRSRTVTRRRRSCSPAIGSSCGRSSRSSTVPRSVQRATASTWSSHRPAPPSTAGWRSLRPPRQPLESRDRASIRVGIGVHAGETAESTEGFVGSAVEHRGTDLRPRGSRRAARQRYRPQPDAHLPADFGSCHARPAAAEGHRGADSRVPSLARYRCGRRGRFRHRRTRAAARLARACSRPPSESRLRLLPPPLSWAR